MKTDRNFALNITIKLQKVMTNYYLQNLLSDLLTVSTDGLKLTPNEASIIQSIGSTYAFSVSNGY